jgi:hypothetical protein
MFVQANDNGRSSIDALLKALGKGRRLNDEATEALERLFGVPVGVEGLSRLFQPGYPGVRSFVVETAVAPDQAIDFTLVGIARDGMPTWLSARAFAKGREGALEIHHGYNEISVEHRSRNITVDLIQRELDILKLQGEAPTSRITIDAEGIGSYVCALHGFEFADETEEGPPVRSTRALEPEGDRHRIMEAAPPLIEKIAQRVGASSSAVERAISTLQSARSPWDILRLQLQGMEPLLAEGDDGEMGVGALGRELLLSKELPPWRAALYRDSTRNEAHRVGDEYRRRKTHRSEARLATEIQAARDQLLSPKRELKVKALRVLAEIAPTWVTPDIKALEEGKERRIANVARHAMRQISGVDLGDRLLAYAINKKHDGRARAIAYRVLAEHHRAKIMPMLPMLRVNPDARIQRAIVPLLTDDPTDAGPQLASLLAANPHEGQDERPGLQELRIELIERLARIRDQRTLPALMQAYRARPPPPPIEMLALSRALVAFPDPRAQLALIEVARRMERPAIP